MPLDAQSLVYLRDTLLVYVQRVYGPNGDANDLDSPGVRNKLTQTITYLFVAMYAQAWGDFFDYFRDLARSKQDSIVGTNPSGLLLYLRILSSIHDEIADMLVPRTEMDQKQSNELKDIIRQRDAQKIALSWQEVLSQWRALHEDVVDLCLKVIARWVSWIDISLVVTEGLLVPLFEIVGRSETASSDGGDILRTTAIDTLTEIVAKKMKPPDKIQLLMFINVENIIAQLVASPSLQNSPSSKSYDTDLAEAVAKLVNTVAAEVIRALDGGMLDEPNRARAEELLQRIVPWLLRFFTDEYDDICSGVIPSLSDLLALFRRDLKAKGTLSPPYTAMLPGILQAIIGKMKYDEGASWGREDEQTDEAEFHELRKKLHVLQQAVAAVDETLYINVLSEVVGSIFEGYSERGGQVDWRDLDLALHEMFLFGELASKNGGLYSKGRPTSAAAETLTNMMAKMVRSGMYQPWPATFRSNGPWHI